MHANYQSISEENTGRYGTAIDEYGPLLLADRYSDRTHFIYELLQNAEDAIGWRLKEESNFDQGVSFHLTPKALFLEHFGLGFSEEHVRAICDIGKGTKRHDLTAIGKHGIGFKSVYAYTQSPEIHSGDEHFVIESYVRPRGIQPKSPKSNGTLFVFPFDHPNVTANDAYSEILRRFHSLDLKTLLFLKNISFIRWSTEDGVNGHYARNTMSVQGGLEKVLVTRFADQASYERSEAYYLFRKEVSHEGSFAGFVEIAFRSQGVPHESLSEQRITRVNESPLVVFFPTEKETHFGFLIQGPYRTTPSRDNIPRDDPWNQHLIQCTADLVSESLPKLRDADKISPHFFDALMVSPEKYSESIHLWMFQPICTAIISTLRNQELIPKSNGGYVAGSHAKMARTAGLRALFSNKQLTELIDSPQSLEWVNEEYHRDDLRSFFVHTLGITELDNESLLRKVDGVFLENQSDEWVRRLYEYLLEQPALRKQAWLMNKPLIRLSTNEHVHALDDLGKPKAFFPSLSRSDFPQVKKTVCDSQSSRQFLEQIGIREPNQIDEIIAQVLPRYAQPLQHFPKTFDDDVLRLLDGLKDDSIQRRSVLLEEIKKANWIPFRNSKTNLLRLGRVMNPSFFPEPRLASLFADIAEVWFIDETREVLHSKESRKLLKDCGATSVLQRRKVRCTLDDSDLEELRRDSDLPRATRGETIDFEVDNLHRVVSHIASGTRDWQDRSLLLWQCLHDSLREYGESFLFGEYQWTFGRSSRTVAFPAQFIRTLRDGAWLPDGNGNLRRPSEVCFEELPRAFQSKANETFVSLLEFRPDEIGKLAEKAGISVELLNFIRKNQITLADLKWKFEVAKPIGQSEGKAGSATDSEVPELKEGNPPAFDRRKSGPGDVDRDPDSAPGNDADDRSGDSNFRYRSRGKESTEDRDGDKKARGHTAEDRDGMIARMVRDLERVTSTGVLPEDSRDFNDLDSYRAAHSDEKYRKAVMDYERARGRIPVPKSSLEQGHDIDSFEIRAAGKAHQLARRIEVKGKSVPWTDDQIVELSARQFDDAMKKRKSEGEGISVTSDFDYWLYIVEETGKGAMNVLPIRNPAQRSAHFELRAGTWRHLIEIEPLRFSRLEDEDPKI
jgi:hypothetical protein